MKTFSEMAEEWERTHGVVGSRGLQTEDEPMSKDDPTAWVNDFLRWRNGRCVSRPGMDDSISVSTLLVDFCEWCVNHDSVPSTRSIFEMLVDLDGHQIKDGKVRGILLRDDLEGVLSWKDAL